MIIKNLSANISKDFSLKNISFELKPGFIFTLLGRSGSGKSSLLRCLAGLQKSESDINEVPKPFGMVFQSANLFSHLTLEENILIALVKVQKKSISDSKKLTERVLQQVQLTHRSSSYPHQLSGGEQQRGAIARALALNPQIIFYDEPTSALDPELVDEVFDLMLSLKKQNIIQVVVSHETRVVQKISDYIGLMRNGELKFFVASDQLKSNLNFMEKDEQKYLQLFI